MKSMLVVTVRGVGGGEGAISENVDSYFSHFLPVAGISIDNNPGKPDLTTVPLTSLDLLSLDKELQ